MRGLILIWFIIWSQGVMVGQSVWYTGYGENQGLDSNDINVLQQGPNGMLWIGTMHGLYKFDGFTFSEVLYNDLNTDKAVYDLAVDDDLVLWIAGRNGLTSFNGANFIHFGQAHSSTDPEYPTRLMVSGSEIIFKDGSGSLFRVKDKKLENFQEQPPGVILDWIRTGEAEFWMLTENGKIHCFSESTLQGSFDISEENGRILSFADGSLSQDGSFKLITDKGVLEAKMDNNESLSHTWIYKKRGIRAFLADVQNRYWLVENDHLLRIAAGDTARIEITVPPEASIYFYEDYEHNIWVNISPGELYKFPGDEITRLDHEVIDNYTPSSYMYLNNWIWISYFGAGVKKLPAGEGSGFGWAEVPGVISNYVRDMVSYQDEIWFITARGVSRMKGSKISHYTTSNGLPHNYCYRAAVDPFGRVLVGTEKGLAIFENGRFRPLDSGFEHGEERVKFLTTIRDGSVLILKETRIDRYWKNEIHPFILEGLLKKEILNTLVEDQFGNFWIGSDLNGLIFFNREEGTLKYVSKEQDLPFSRVRTVVPTGDRNICLGTEKGIYYLGIDKDGVIASIQSFGLERGYPDMDVNINASLKINDRIYFGTNMGTVIFQPDRIEINPVMPVTHISGLDLSFRETDWAKTSQKLNTWFRIPVQPILNHEQNDLLLHYGAFSLRSSDKLWYKYWLENNDKTWSKPTRNTSAIYANLPPGNYIFHVKASYDGFNWGEAYSSYSLIIAPPFWKTWWFYIIVFSFILVGFILFNNYRIKSKINQLLAIERLKKEEYSRIQKKIAMDFHDEVGNHLTSISLLVELIKRGGWEIEDELKNLLNKIDDEYKNLFRGKKDFIWSIDPENDNLKAVFHNIRDYGMDLFDNSSIHFHAQNGNTDFSSIKMPAGFTRHIVLIFKEGLNNVLKHAGCKNVYFSISVSGKDLEIKLKDDGRGFREEDLYYLEGIKKMKYRGAKIKSDLVLKSDENLGTEIILKAKI